MPRRRLLLLPLLLLACSEPEPVPPQTTQARLAAAPDIATGRQAFRICRTCHEAAAGTGHRVGPNLWSVVGAPSARHADFAYSQGMRRAELVWDEATLDAYLRAPQAVVPGTRMAYPGMPDPADRRDVIAYLKTLDGS